MNSAKENPDDLRLNLVDGTVICLPNAIDVLTSYIVLEQEDWFEDEIKFVRRLLRPGMKVLDIGASFGLYTLAAAKVVGSEGRVWSVEPAGLPSGFLEKSIEANAFHHVELIRSALSNYQGKAEISYAKDSELGSLSPGDDLVDAPLTRETVPVTSMDALVEKHNISNVDFLKLDAEGEEERIIEGGESFFKENSPLIMFEIKDKFRFDLSLAKKFEGIGYNSFRLVPGLNALVPFDSREAIDRYLLNLFCCKEDRASLLENGGILTRTAPGDLAPPAGKEKIWSDFLGSKPYARQFLPLWTPETGQEVAPGWDRYETALNAYALAHSQDLPLGDRHNHLLFCLHEIMGIVEKHGTFARLNTLARAAGELGVRDIAIDTLQRILGLLDGRGLQLGEPFVPANERFDLIDPGEDVKDWVIVGLLEQLDKLSAYSSYFIDPKKNLWLLETIRKHKFHTPQSERRWQLKRLLEGLQENFEAAAILSEKAPGNLNPDHWKTGAAPRRRG